MTEKDSSKSEAVGIDREKSTAIAESSASTPLEAGRELDALVAEKVMGWKWRRPDPVRNGYVSYSGLFPDSASRDSRIVVDSSDALLAKCVFVDGNVPHFSTDISDAWRVVEKLREDGWVIGLWIDDEPWDAADEDGTHGCSLLGCNRGRADATDIREYADTTPLAICLAALRSLNQRT